MTADESRPATDPVPAPRARKVVIHAKAYYDLGKVRLSMLAVFAVLAGLWIGHPENRPPLGLVVATTLGTFLVAVGSSSLNMFIERGLDRRMQRTSDRPLPSGRLDPEHALAFGLACGAVGIGVLGVATNWLATSLCAAILVIYVCIYTPLKRVTTLNTLVGAVPGALPPVVGLTAVTGELGADAYLLFLILFFWQIPHFLAIAWRYREDYARSGMRMLPSVAPDGRTTGLQMFVYCCALVISSVLPYLYGLAGEAYLGAAIVLDVLFLVPTTMAAVYRTDAFMRLTFMVSIAYLPLLLGAMVLDRMYS